MIQYLLDLWAAFEIYQMELVSIIFGDLIGF